MNLQERMQELAGINENPTPTEEEMIHAAVYIGFSQLKHYKPAVVLQVRKVMDWLVSIGVAEYGTIFRGGYSLVNRSNTVEKAQKLAYKGFKQNKFKVDFLKLSGVK